MGLFGSNNETVTTTFAAKDQMSPVVRGIRSTMDQFKRDASTGFGLAAGISVFSAATKAIDFAGDALRAFADDQASVAKLTTAIRENSDAWDGNIKAVEDVIRSRMRLGFADDEQRDGLALLVAQIGDVNDALKVQRVAMDLARLKGMSLAEAGTVLARAYNGSTTALQKMGIRLKKGTDGLEAIEAVQARVTGQAQAYAETLAGSADVMAVSFDEFKESVGGALNDALNPFFKLVVDLTNQTPDLDTALGRLTQSYRDQIEAAKYAAQTTEQGGTIFDDVGKRIYAMVSAQDAAIHDFTGTLADAGRILGVTRHDFALFVEAGLTAGQSIDEIRASIDALVQQHVEEKAKTIGYAWQTGMSDVETSTQDAIHVLHQLPPEARHAVMGMGKEIKQGKAAIVEQFRQLAWQTKHPFAQTNYEDWLRGRMAAAVRKMKQAEKAGHTGLVEQYRQLVQDIKAELEGLPGYTAGLAADVIADLGSIGPAVTRAMGFGEDGHATPVRPKKHPKHPKRPRGNKAAGGPVEAGGAYLVGERGPEMLVMGSRGGNIVPNHSGGIRNVIVLDGRVIYDSVNRRLGRDLAMGG